MLTEEEARNITTELAKERAKLNIDMTHLNSLRLMMFDNYHPSKGEELKMILHNIVDLTETMYHEATEILRLLSDQEKG